jgi:hypothetical protein
MPDHRQAGKVACRLDEILLLARLAHLAGAEGFTDIARFGHKKLDLLRGTVVIFVSGAIMPPMEGADGYQERYIGPASCRT